jgi:hypothetical protein
MPFLWKLFGTQALVMLDTVVQSDWLSLLDLAYCAYDILTFEVKVSEHSYNMCIDVRICRQEPRGDFHRIHDPKAEFPWPWYKVHHDSWNPLHRSKASEVQRSMFVLVPHMMTLSHIALVSRARCPFGRFYGKRPKGLRKTPFANRLSRVILNYSRCTVKCWDCRNE